MFQCVSVTETHTMRLVMLICVSDSAPSHYPKQCWPKVKWTFGNILQWNFSQNTEIIYSRKWIWKLSSAKCQPFCVCLNVITPSGVILVLDLPFLFCDVMMSLFFSFQAQFKSNFVTSSDPNECQPPPPEPNPMPPPPAPVMSGFVSSSTNDMGAPGPPPESKRRKKSRWEWM